MASILDRYGIKEVADVTFYEIQDNGMPGKPVLFLDTLKVSTIEQTAEQADARGGKGNPKLITWDYGKEITVTIEDALFSAKSMSIMFGDGTVATNDSLYIRHTATLKVDSEGHIQDYFFADIYDANAGSVRKKIWLGAAENVPAGYVTLAASGIVFAANAKDKAMLVSEDGTTRDNALTSATLMSYVSASALANDKDKKVMFTYFTLGKGKTISISGDSFPGTYYVQGDTYSRSDTTGKDQFFQFIIPKCKMTSENTITLEADGDPSTFSMNLTVLRPEDGEMMKLVQYDLTVQG